MVINHFTKEDIEYLSLLELTTVGSFWYKNTRYVLTRDDLGWKLYVYPPDRSFYVISYCVRKDVIQDIKNDILGGVSAR